MKKRMRILRGILSSTGSDRILFSYLAFVFLDALMIWIFEPSIGSYGDALWYCYAVISTAGFGDFTATALIPRLLSAVLTVYSLLVIAIITGVVVNFYTQLIEIKNRETFTAFLDSLEHLTDMSGKEIEELQEKVKVFRKKRGGL